MSAEHFEQGRIAFEARAAVQQSWGIAAASLVLAGLSGFWWYILNTMVD